MNSFKSFVDHIFKITEEYELNEMSIQGVITHSGVLIKHLLCILENQGDTRLVGSTVSDIREMVKGIERQINDITGKAESNLDKATVNLVIAFDQGLHRFEKQYEFTPRSITSKKFMEKAYSMKLRLEDLGITVEILSKRKVGLSFSLNNFLQLYKV
jgi:hypothetical protein